MKKKLTIIAFVALIGLNIYFLSEWKSAESNRLYYDYAIPHIELISAMAFYGVDSYQGELLSSPNQGDIAIGGITGFIVFSNPTDQPKDARQYYTIEATDRYDEESNQLFLLTDTLKLNAIPPHSFEKEELKVVSNNGQFVTLENESNQTFKINKRTDEVIITDADGDTTTLITNQSDYKDFVFKFMK